MRKRVACLTGLPMNPVVLLSLLGGGGALLLPNAIMRVLAEYGALLPPPPLPVGPEPPLPKPWMRPCAVIGTPYTQTSLSAVTSAKMLRRLAPGTPHKQVWQS